MLQYKEEVEKKALSWFKELLRIDTSNPPGNEKLAIDYIAKLVKSFGLEPQIIAKDSNRPNLFVAIDGAKPGPKILLSSHVDVVPIENKNSWRFDPFSATEADDCIWSRGTLDMKFKTAFDLALLSTAIDQKDSFSGRIEMVCLADEEVSFEHGSRFLMQEHRDLFQSTHVFNESGGFNFQLGDSEFLVFLAGEKHLAQLRLHTSGISTHSSLPPKDTAINLLGQLIASFANEFLGYQLCPTSLAFLDGIEANSSPALKPLVSMLKDANSVETALSMLPDPFVQVQLRSMLCHTLASTRIGGGFAANVIPESAWVDFNCRIVPNVTIKDFSELVQKFISISFPKFSDRVHLEFLDEDLGYEIKTDDQLFKAVTDGLEDFWSSKPTKPKAVPILLPAGSDCRNYAQAGINPIGFAPLYFPPGFPGFSLAHAVDERVPISAFKDGLKAFVNVIAKILK